MPKEMKGEHFPTTATVEVVHGSPTIEQGIPGIALKQTEAPYGTGLNEQTAAGNPVATAIVVGEDFVIDYKGVVEVDAVGGVAVGDPVYLVTATLALQEAGGAGTVPFGKCVAVAGARPYCPTGKMHVDLDLKPFTPLA